MARFLLGFVVASLLWAGAAAGLHWSLGWGPPAEEIEEEAVEEVATLEEPPEESTGRRRRRRPGSASARSGRSGGSVPTGDATVGDDLRESEMRTIDGAGSGGEAQLSGAQIEHAFDGAMGRIRRCFILAPGDEPVTGTLTFGLRIAGTGRVSAINLSGPRALTTGEPGDCLRDAARAISFPAFDGPEMLVRFPITLE